MAQGTVGRNLTFQIFNSDGTPFNDLVLHKATYDSVVMSLGDKITGDVYYRGTDLAVTMGEYVEYDGVKFVLVSPPVIVREGMVSDNSELKGLTKYSFTFYHPMYMLANFPFSDVAVSNDQKKYLSENKSFSWIGNLTDFVAKINKNLDNTQWYCDISLDVQQSDREKLSEVMAFDKESIADAIKRGYETWKFPYIIDSIKSTDTRYSTQYAQGKRFLIQFGLPTRQIVKNSSTFIFEYGQGVGLKNNSRTPRNNKIITRIAGYGSEDNIPYGYPQIQWYGNQSWDYTVNNSSSAANSYPIYDGIVGGQKVRLIKHPFTRTHLMPTIYATTLFNKISPYVNGGSANPNYDPTLELVDYYDAINTQSVTWPNPIKTYIDEQGNVIYEPSYEIHEFEDIKPELQSRHISSVGTYDNKYKESVTMGDFLDLLEDFITQSQFDEEKEQLEDIKNGIGSHDSDSGSVTPSIYSVAARQYSCKWSYYKDDYYAYVKYESNGQNFEYIVRLSDAMPTPAWDDTMDDDGNYVQSYFTLTLPALGFDLYACAAITQEMSINMRSGDCLGCTFPVMVDWDDYKKNFYDDEGNFDPVIGTGHPRDAQKYPNSTSAAITVVVQKDLNTFGTLMPNIYQKPAANDDFVILGISLPQSYVTNAQTRLEQDMKQYMRDNNVHYYDYPLKFDEYFLANNTDILQQMRPNVVVKFKYNGTTLALYIKQFTVKFGDKPLPEYNITLTDDVEIVLNEIGKVSEEVSNLRILMGEGGGGGGLNDNRYLRKDKDDTAAGLIRLIKGLQVGENFVTGLLGEGGIFRKDADGTTYLECDKMYVRMKAYFDTVEVRRFIHSGGNRIASAAGIKCSRVEWLTSGGVVTDNINNVAKFRCYFRANDDGKQITNDFEANDLAYCKETNINVSQGLSQRFYWRKVVGVSSSVNADGEHYIDISKSDCLSGSDYPLAQDDIIQLGNTTDTTRQGAIVEYVSGEDAPSYQIYQGINTYSLESKNYVSLGYKSDTGRAYMNVYGDFYFGDRPASGQTEGSSFIRYNQETEELDVKANVEFTHPESTYGTENLDDFIAAITQNIGNIQDQVDGNIESWFYDYMPVAVDATGAPLNKIPLVINNGSPVHPYYDWYTIDGGGTAHEVRTEREKHLGDTFYDNSSGYAFRFTVNSGTNAFEWTMIEDSAVIKALADAAKAQDTADHKRRAFVLPVTIGGVTYNYPYPPYDVGDLWLNAKYPYNYDGVTDAENNKYNNDVLRCITSQDANGSFSISHWVLASKYTDDSALTAFVNGTYAPFVDQIQGQVDQKAETWRQISDPSTAWTDDETKKIHVGDIWMDISPNGGNKTKIYQNIGTEQQPNYDWVAQAVPTEVFDEIDGKAAIYVNNPNSAQNPTPTDYKAKDLWILGGDATINGVSYKAGEILTAKNDCATYNASDWEKKVRYTGDEMITRYIDILTNGSYTGGSVNVDVIAAAEYAINHALNDGTTTVDGGLILSNIIALRDTTQSIMSGLNGVYNASLNGGGIAAWYGGAMVDIEALTGTAKTTYDNLTPAQKAASKNYAKSLHRFDGSGYLAQGNITWTDDGKLTIKDIHTIVDGQDTTYDVGTTLNYATTLYSLFHTSTYSNVVYINPQNAFDHIDLVHTQGSGYQISDSSVLNYGEMKSRFVPLEFFNALFTAYHDNTAINPWTWTDTASAQRAVINNLKVMVGTWTNQYLSALGLNSGSGGSSVQLNEPLNGINNSGLSAPSAGTMTGTLLVFNGSNGWTYSHNRGIYALSVSSGSTVTSVSGFVKQGHTNDEVLLAGGGTAQLSSISVAAATASTLGTIKVGDVLTSSPNVISNTGSAARNYAVLLRADGVAFVQVPWENTDTDTKNTTGTGVTQASGNCYIVCATSQDSNGVQTYTQSNAYIKGGYLYSGGSKVLTAGTYTLDDVADGTTRKLSDYTKTVDLGSMAYESASDYALLTDIPDTSDMATMTWVTNQHYITGYTDTKNTAGSTNNASTKMFIIGATSQGANPQTYSNANCYIDTDNCLYSNGSKVLTSSINQLSLPSTPTDFNFYESSYNKVGFYIMRGVTNHAPNSNGYYGYLTNYRWDNGYWSAQFYLTVADFGYEIYTRGCEGNGTWKPWKKFINDANIGDYLTGYATQSWVTSQGYLTSTLVATASALGMVKVNQSYGTAATLESSGNIQGRNYGLQIDSNQKAFVYVPWENTDTDTKNTAGTNNLASTKLYLVGATEQSANPVTYSNANCYVGTDNCLYSDGSKVFTESLGAYKLSTKTIGNQGANIWEDYNKVVIYQNTGKTTGFPTSYNYGYLFNFRWNSGTWSTQFYLTVSDFGHEIFTRGYRDDQNAWTSWKKFINDANIGDYAILKTGGTATGSITATSFIKSGGTSSQFLKADGSVDNNVYATQNWVGTQGYLKLVNGNANIDKSLVLGCNASGSSSFSISTSNADHDIVIQANKLTLKGLGDTSGSGGTLLPNGAKFYSICIESNSDGTVNSSHSGEINRFGSDLHLQYDSTSGVNNYGGVTLAQQAFKFWKQAGNAYLSTNNLTLQVNTGNGSPYINKSWIVTSDIRKKDVVKYAEASINKIAEAPIFDFRWKYELNGALNLGTSAQYWEMVFPNAVKTTPDGYLGMDYSSIALASAVLTARKVVDHEKRIRLLEVENEALRREIDQLKLKNAA